MSLKSSYNIISGVKCGIYKISFPESKYTYVGQSSDLRNRIRTHYSQLVNKKHKNTIMQNVFNKHKKIQFDILEYCSIDRLTEREQFYLDREDLKYSCNLARVGRSRIGFKLKPSQVEKLRMINLGSKKSEDTKRKIAEMKKYLTPQQRKNISEAQKNRKISKEKQELANEKRRNFMLNVSQEYKDKMSKSTSGDLNGAAKLVLNFETGVYYGSAKSAHIDSGYKYDYFKMMLNGNTKNKTNFKYV